MANNAELLKVLELASQRLQHHHNALWEEEKHYSWWIYIIFAGLIYLYFELPSVKLLVEWQRALLMGLGSLFGIFISFMGFNVIRREGEYFYEAIRICNHTIATLKFDQPMPNQEGSGPNALMPQGKLRDQANLPLRKLVVSVFKGNDRKGLGIRDCFQLTFLITALLFLGFGVFSIITLLN